MKREEAVAIYKEIIKLADCMGSNSFNLKLSKKDDPHSEARAIAFYSLFINRIYQAEKT